MDHNGGADILQQACPWMRFGLFVIGDGLPDAFDQGRASRVGAGPVNRAASFDDPSLHPGQQVNAGGIQRSDGGKVDHKAPGTFRRDAGHEIAQLAIEPRGLVDHPFAQRPQKQAVPVKALVDGSFHNGSFPADGWSGPC
jgi:hypothetical protein